MRHSPQGWVTPIGAFCLRGHVRFSQQRLWDLPSGLHLQFARQELQDTCCAFFHTLHKGQNLINLVGSRGLRFLPRFRVTRSTHSQAHGKTGWTATHSVSLAPRLGVSDELVELHRIQKFRDNVQAAVLQEAGVVSKQIGMSWQTGKVRQLGAKKRLVLVKPSSETWTASKQLGGGKTESERSGLGCRARCCFRMKG